MKEFKLIIAGSRAFNNYELLISKVNDLCVGTGPYTDRAVSIVSGMARGADQLAIDFAREFGVQLYTFPAAWAVHGKGAGFIRNEEMANFADGLLAFWDGVSHGTSHMIQTMQTKRKPVHVVLY